ncbi:MAG TPA: glycosyltransferase family 4 protein [Candidatus Dormibacteraeota bacterium]|jgi:glycosyltransferase involved in cell wall biosynthesis|nr:glycosyltransferase family 4 protein [Candidatus Dormibacteraeota bacterium]
MLGADTIEVVMVSFEGPDQYSQAGGLGVRAKELCRALAAMDVPTTLVFVGDPERPFEETDRGVHLVRWAQQVSRRYPAGVYQGEHDKIADVCASLPRYLADEMVAPAASRRRLTVLLAEEWQTATACTLVSDVLEARGLRDRCAVLWNANNLFGFERIDWAALQRVATVTTVSRYMKLLMRQWGVNPLVIPNGIPSESLRPVNKGAVRTIRDASQTPCLAFKIGRFSEDKRWHQAVASIADLRRHGVAARLLLRGGIEPYGGQVLEHARSLGLDVSDWAEPVRDAAGVAAALAATDAALVNLRSFLPDAVVPQIYAASDAVLANSGHEPFGLVGLETMAAGGVACVGATGEEYARPYANAVVVETEDPAELASALRGLVERPELVERLRRNARRDAAEFSWPHVIDGLLERLRFVSEHQGVSAPA